MANYDEIKVVASLAVTETISTIEKQLKEISPQLKGLQITGTLNLETTKQTIQAQLRNLGNLSVNVSGVNFTGIQSAQATLKNSFKSVQSKINVDTTNIIAAKQELDKLAQATARANNLKVSGIKYNSIPTDTGEKLNTASIQYYNERTQEAVTQTYALRNAQNALVLTGTNFQQNITKSEKATASLTASIVNYQNKLSQLKSGNANLIKANPDLTSKINAVNFSDNIKSDVDLQNMINKYSQLENMIKQYKSVMSNRNAEIEADQQLKKLSNTLSELRVKFANIKSSNSDLISNSVFTELDTLSQKLKQVAQISDSTKKSLETKIISTNVNDLQSQAKTAAMQGSANSEQMRLYSGLRVGMQELNKLRIQELSANKSGTNEIQSQIIKQKELNNQIARSISQKKLTSTTLNSDISNLANQLENSYNVKKSSISGGLYNSFLGNSNSDLKKINEMLNNATVKQNNNNPQVATTVSQLSNLKQQYSQLQSTVNNTTSFTGLRTATTQLESLRVSLGQTTSGFNNFLNSLRNEATINTVGNRIDVLRDKILKFMQVNNRSVAIRNINPQLNSMLAQLSTTTSGNQIVNLERQFASVQRQAALTGMTGSSVLTELKSKLVKFTSWFGISFITMGILSKVRSALTELKEVDTLLTEISKTSNRSASSLQQLGENAPSEANKYGATITGYLEGVREMSRAGFGEGQSEELGRLSILAQSAGDMTSELANEYLVATNYAYNYKGSVEKLNAVLDAQNQITNRNAVNMTELAEATKIAANQMYNSNIDVPQASALLSTGLVTTQMAGQEVGRAVKGLMMNLQSVSGVTDDGDVLDESTFKKVEKRLSSVGVQMETISNGTAKLRNPIDILTDLAKVYNSMAKDDARRAGIIEDVGGKFRGNVLSSILSNWSTYEKILGDYANSEGSALQEAEKTANSWQGLSNKLSNTWVQLVQNFAGTDFIKNTLTGLNDFLTLLDAIIDKLGVLPTLIAGIGISRAVLGKSKLFGTNEQGLTLFNANVKEMGVRNILSGVGTGIRGSLGVTPSTQSLPIEALSETSFNAQALAYNQAVAANNTKSFVNALDNTNLKKYFNTLNGGTASYASYANSVNVANQRTAAMATTAEMASKRIASIKSALAATALNLGITAVIAGLTILISKIVSYKQEQQKAIEKRRDDTISAIDAYKDEENSLDTLIDKYQGIVTSTQDVETAKSNLEEVQTSLCESYGAEADNIDLVNGKYADQIEKLNEIKKIKADSFLEENEVPYNEAKENLSKQKTVSIGMRNDETTSKLQPLLRTALQKQGLNPNNLHYSNNSGTLSYIYGNLDERIKYLSVLEDTYSKVSDVTKGSGLKKYAEINEELKSLKTEYESYAKIVTEYESIETQKKTLSFYDGYYEDIAKFENLKKKIDEATNPKDIQKYREAMANLKSDMFQKIGANSLLPENQGFVDPSQALNVYKSKVAAGLNGINKEVTLKQEQTVKDMFAPYEKFAGATFKNVLDNAEISVEDYGNQLKKYQDLASTLKTAFTEQKNNKVISNDSYNTLIQDGYGSALEYSPQLQGYTILTDKIKELTKAEYGETEAKIQAKSISLTDMYKQETDSINKKIEAAKKSGNLDLVSSLTTDKSNLDIQYREGMNTLEVFSNTFSGIKKTISDSSIVPEVDNVDKIALISKAVENLQNSYSTLSTVSQQVTDSNKIDLDTLTKLQSTYPELSNAVADYMGGLISAQDVLSLASKSYQQDLLEYKSALLLKLEGNSEFYQQFLQSNVAYVDYLKSTYGIDLNNYKDFAVAKLDVQQQLINQSKSNWDKFYKIEIDKTTGRASVTNLNGDSGIPHINSKEDYLAFKGGKEQAYNSALKTVNDINAGINNAVKSINIDENALGLSNTVIDDIAKKEFANLEHIYAMGEIQSEEYYRRLNVLNEKYYANNSQYLDEYNSNLEKIHAGTKEIFDDKKANLDHDLAMDYITEDNYYTQLMNLAEQYYGGKTAFLREYQSVEEDYYKHSKELQQEVYQDKIDALQEVNDQSQKLIDLEKARIALENAQRNKTINTYSSEKGWQYEADQSAIQEAKSAYQNQFIDFTKGQLERAKSAQTDNTIIPLSDNQLSEMWGISMNMLKNTTNSNLTSGLNQLTNLYTPNTYMGANNTTNNSPVFNLNVGTVEANNPQDFANNFNTYLNNFLTQAGIMSFNR